MPLFLIKWGPLKSFDPLLIANMVKGAVSGLKQFLATETPRKIMKNTFYFILTNRICYWQIRFCTYYAYSLNQVSNILEVFKYWPLEDGFRSITQKFCRAVFCGGWTKQLQTISRHFF